uniref:PHD finger protein 20 n=1 Tax=Ornithorhynchus anatinus TaxID=9258 RepID=A0A6I8NB26_ORNAN
MTKHPPNRRGINFEVGAQLEARDRLKNWYPAHIEEIDYEEGRVLIHFKRWNHRYDEWFCWDSPYLRPLEKIQLRKEGLHEEEGPSVSNDNCDRRRRLRDNWGGSLDDRSLCAKHPN